MPMTLNGSGTITGLVAGGLPDGTITGSDLAPGAAATNLAGTAVPGTVTLGAGGTTPYTAAVLRANYPNTYRWKINLADRGGGIDLDFIGTNDADTEVGGLQLSIPQTGRGLKWLGGQVSTSNDIATITANGSFGLTAGVWTPIANLEPYSGTYALHVSWNGLNNPGTVIWDGVASGIVALNSSNIYNASPEEILNMNAIYHHRTVTGLRFKFDSDGTQGSYGNQTLYVMSPDAGGTLGGVYVKIRGLI